MFDTWNRIKEGYLLVEIKEFRSFCNRRRIPYAFFGGLGTAAFLGQLPPRLIHDVDVIVPDAHGRVVREFLVSTRRFRNGDRDVPSKVGFARFAKRVHGREIVFQVFSERFTLFDNSGKHRRPLWTYDFSAAIEHAKSHPVWNLDKTDRVTLRAIPLEDLILSKLWPYFESSMFYDLLFLLQCSVQPKTLNAEYLSSRLRGSPQIMRMQCLSNIHHFGRVIQARNRFTPLINKKKVAGALGLIRDIVAASTNGKNHGSGSNSNG